MIRMFRPLPKPLLLLFLLFSVVLLSSSADASPDVSADDLDGRTFVFSSGPGMWDFGDGTITYSRGTISHTFDSGVWHPVFTDSSGSSSLTVSVRDDLPITDATVGSEYRCSMVGMVGAHAFSMDGTVSDWLSFDPVTDAAVGTPDSIGEELVNFIFSDGTTWSFHMSITDGDVIPEEFGIKITSSGLTIHADPTIPLSGRFVEWSIYSLDGSRVAVSSGSVLDVTLSNPGTYCVTVSTTFGSPALSASGIVTVSDPSEEDHDRDDRWTVVAIIVAIVAAFFVIRRII